MQKSFLLLAVSIPTVFIAMHRTPSENELWRLVELGDRAAVPLKTYLGIETNPIVDTHKEKLTPLQFAASKSYLRLIPILLTAGADPRARDPQGRTVLDVAQSNGSDDKYLALIAQRMKELEAVR